ncbi:uncharacterized protein LOC143233511 [Tachypleus tridentatus]|uniref:uncharacterized protein LOC143233511 n=1 Tax=Tachypleus tridentatus TaxID=6853 RepID=UPI003FD1B1D4
MSRNIVFLSFQVTVFWCLITSGTQIRNKMFFKKIEDMRGLMSTTLTTDRTTPIGCTGACLNDWRCYGVAVSPPSSVPQVCDLLGVNTEIISSPGWKIYWNSEKVTYRGLYVNSNSGSPTDPLVSWYADCNNDPSGIQNGVIVAFWDNNFSEEPDIDYLKCLHVHDPELPLLDTTQAEMFSTREDLVCPPDHVVTALHDDNRYFHNMDFFKCVHLMQPWTVNNATCKQITSTPSLDDGPIDDFSQWNFECPNLGQGYSVVVGVFTMDIDIRLTCCSLIQAL